MPLNQQVNTPNGPVSGAQAAFNWSMQSFQASGVPIPHGCQFEPKVLSHDRDKGNNPNIETYQVSRPTAERSQVNAVEGQPVGNGYRLSEPPIQRSQGDMTRAAPPGCMEELPECALASNSDSMLGEIDGFGGTWTDFSPTSKTEEVRSGYKEFGPNPQGGQR
jgi:hypothetical protein